MKTYRITNTIINEEGETFTESINVITEGRVVSQNGVVFIKNEDGDCSFTIAHNTSGCGNEMTVEEITDNNQ